MSTALRDAIVMSTATIVNCFRVKMVELVMIKLEGTSVLVRLARQDFFATWKTNVPDQVPATPVPDVTPTKSPVMLSALVQPDSLAPLVRRTSTNVLGSLHLVNMVALVSTQSGHTSASVVQAILVPDVR